MGRWLLDLLGLTSTSGARSCWRSALVGVLLIVYLVVRRLFLITVWTDTRVPESVTARGETARAGVELFADIVG